MKSVIQRVIKSKIKIEGEDYSSIDNGMLILVGFHTNDILHNIDKMALKISKLRIFGDEKNKMNKNINEINGQVLVVSQFTLCANTKKGNRPSFFDAAQSDFANKLYLRFIEKLEDLINNDVKTGKFGAQMQLELINDGPVTLTIEN
ncbi:D-aminoacyl-tRNA deacylase [bacterium]|nr:D-aminoacyl-tRNA deacylase [bacterium]